MSISFIDKAAHKVEAVRATLGLPPPNELPAPGVVAAGLDAMGIEPDPTWKLPQCIDEL